jgi:hypothetical protein
MFFEFLPTVGDMRLSLPVERKTPKERHPREKPTVSSARKFLF